MKQHLSSQEIQSLLAQTHPGGEVKILKIGSLHDSPEQFSTPEIPDQLFELAKKLNITLTISTMRFNEFIQLYPTLIGTDQLPEIIVGEIHPYSFLWQTIPFWEHFQEAEGLLGKLAGFALLSVDAPGYQLALKLVFGMPVLEPSLSQKHWLLEADASPHQLLQPLVLEVSRAYLERNMLPLQNVADPDYFKMTKPHLRANPPTSSFEPVILSLFGLENLIFALVRSKFVSHQKIGYFQVATIWRKTSQLNDSNASETNSLAWQLLLASHDPLTMGNFMEDAYSYLQQDQLVEPSENSNGQNKPAPTQQALLPAQLLFPLDGESALQIDPETGQPVGGKRFGEMIWQPSPSPEVIAEVMEVEYDTGNRLFWLTLLPGRSSPLQISTGKLWGGSSCSWRVWSIGIDGQVVFSTPRRMR